MRSYFEIDELSYLVMATFDVLTAGVNAFVVLWTAIGVALNASITMNSIKVTFYDVAHFESLVAIGMRTRKSVFSGTNGAMKV